MILTVRGRGGGIVLLEFGSLIFGWGSRSVLLKARNPQEPRARHPQESQNKSNGFQVSKIPLEKNLPWKPFSSIMIV